ncbi:MAG: hypothetical protein HFE78_03210 [Clostridiales bacterium]|nr:hypothetical protein [Clostridiales bacterium]
MSIIKSYKITIAALLALSLIMTFCSGCSSHRVSFEQSRKNFAKYQEQIAEVLERHTSDVEVLDENLDLKENGGVRLELRYKIDKQNISIYLDNLYGYEDFSLSVRLDCSNIDSHKTGIDLEQVVQFLDVFSGYEFTEEELLSVIDAPNGKYEMGDRIESDIVAKYKPINFMEDWRVSYRIAEKPDNLKGDENNADYYEKLVVCGLTK